MCEIVVEKVWVVGVVEAWSLVKMVWLVSMEVAVVVELQEEQQEVED